MKNASVTARLTGKEIKKIDSLISADAARHLLREEAPEIPELFHRLQSQAKAKQLTKDKILKDIRSVRRHLYMETFGDD